MWYANVYVSFHCPSPQHGIHTHSLLDRSGDGAHPCRLCAATFGRCDRRSSRNPKGDVGPAQLPLTSFHVWSGRVGGNCMHPIDSICTWLFHNGFKSIGIGKQKSTHDCEFQIWVRDSNMETIPEVCHVCVVGSLSAVEGSSSMSRYYSKSYCGMKIPQESQQLDRLFYQLKRLGCPKVGVLTLWNLEWCSQWKPCKSIHDLFFPCMPVMPSTYTLDMVLFVHHPKPLVYRW